MAIADGWGAGRDSSVVRIKTELLAPSIKPYASGNL
jgi:hypothetical protein